MGNRKYNNNKSKPSRKQTKVMKDWEETKDTPIKGKRNYETNDVSWYTANAQRVLDAGRLSFNIPTGSPVDLHLDPAIMFLNNTAPSVYKFPGVMSLDFIPTYGALSDPADPLNVAARSIYSDVRVTNSGAKNYDPNDLMIYLIAMDNVFMWYQFMVRVYGIAMLYNKLNRHLPVTLFDAMNVDMNDVITHLSDYRAYLNQVAAKLGRLCVPNTFPLFLRHMWMCSGIYADSPTDKAQYYIFVPRKVGYFDETAVSTGGSIQPYNLNFNVKFSIAYMQTVMDTLISAIIGSEDSAIISGDILKYCGESGVFTVSQIADDYKVIPVYNQEVLRQIQNATVFDSYANDVTYDANGMLYQDLSGNMPFLRSSIEIPVDSFFYTGDRVLTGSDGAPTPEEVLVSTRLMSTGFVVRKQQGTSTTPSLYVFTPYSYGSEIIVKAIIHGIPDDTLGGQYAVSNRLAYAFPYVNMNPASDTWKRFMRIYSYAESFNYHPRFSFTTRTFDPDDGDITGEDIWSYEDVDNYTIVSDSTMYNLHQSVLLSLFNVGK